MFIGRRESTIESESSDENVVSFRRKVRNRISSSSSSDTDESYASEDIEELLEELALDEEEKLNTADNSLENIRQQSFPFTGKSGLLLDLPSGISPGEVLSLFLNETVISLLVTETNRYAEQKLLEHKTTGHAGQNKWNLTTSEEIKKFIGLMIWMGLVQTPLKKCWSTDPVYNFSLPRSTMSRNRFEELLSNLHFANNETIVQNNKLGKVLPLVDILMVNYQKVFSPGKDIVVDETMVPWRGRLVFRQYIPTKSHKYGVKLFKLCSTEGYTWSSKIYSGRDTSGKRKVGIAESVCTELADKLLNEGRTLFVDNFYTSYELALKFLNSKTHVVGTVRRNKKKKPSCVMYPLKRGEMVAREDPNGIVVLFDTFFSTTTTKVKRRSRWPKKFVLFMDPIQYRMQQQSGGSNDSVLVIWMLKMRHALVGQSSKMWIKSWKSSSRTEKRHPYMGDAGPTEACPSPKYG
ncbi:PREDICTED: piggyBac transposable element-derived protein 4-like [Habropoda laboriosa]|uniref:piggyBac transposable element-derived protein 4-like n=1 Tax=Habropoda laboriosa TaxID=597456 RepID=UPI00083E1B4A|nr:PREDICTED: piggyBac transposable element-derived protein 4-like [Habropoda laboriosa]